MFSILASLSTVYDVNVTYVAKLLYFFHCARHHYTTNLYDETCFVIFGVNATETETVKLGYVFHTMPKPTAPRFVLYI